MNVFLLTAEMVITFKETKSESRLIKRKDNVKFKLYLLNVNYDACQISSLYLI